MCMYIKFSEFDDCYAIICHFKMLLNINASLFSLNLSYYLSEYIPYFPLVHKDISPLEWYCGVLKLQHETIIFALQLMPNRIQGNLAQQNSKL